MAELKNISKIFESKTIFRIPDYQRGFSWEKEHLQALWNDIENITEGRKHYTGAIKLVEISKKEIESNPNKWQEISKNKDIFTNIYSIVDGQQRITTILIWISVILQNFEKEEKEKTDTLKKHNFDIEDKFDTYFYYKSPFNDEKTYFFGYDYDDPSEKYLKKFIFENNSDEKPEIETLYTKNLKFAKKFIFNKIKDWSFEEKQELFNKITKKLIFDYITLDEGLDINVIFETENNRGKGLSNLEKLKNRLIFLASIEKDNNKFETLRKKINETWRVIYQVIGMSKKLSDDDFLKSHWIMYCRYVKSESESYAKDIFNRVFYTNNLTEKKITSKDIDDYVENLKISAIYWYIIHNPTEFFKNKDKIPKNFKTEIKINITENQIEWLEKLNRLGFKMFKPIILAALLSDADNNKKTELLKAIEKYIFVIFAFSRRKVYTGRYNFFRAANRLFKEDNQNKFFNIEMSKTNIEGLINEIYGWTKHYYDEDNFSEHINNIGLSYWSEKKYFTDEYEIFLNNNKLERNIDSLTEFIEDENRWNIHVPSEIIKKILNFGSPLKKIELS